MQENFVALMQTALLNDSLLFSISFCNFVSFSLSLSSFFVVKSNAHSMPNASLKFYKI